MELLKQGDFVVVYDVNNGGLVRGIVIADEVEGSQVYVAVASFAMVNQNYCDRNLIIKVG